MPRRWRRSRSRWRRSLGRGAARLLAPALVMAVVVVLAVGGVAQIGRASGPYHRTVDLGYAAMLSSAVAESNDSGAALRALVAQAPLMARVPLFSALDRLQADAGHQDRVVRRMTPPSPAGGAGTPCRATFDGRAAAVSSFRQAIEGVLGGAAGTAPADPGTALGELEAAGAALGQADASWLDCRHRLRAAPGRPRLGASVWLSGSADWSAAGLDGLVAAVTRSPALAAHHALAIAALTTDPAALPAGGTTVVPPTSSLGVHVVVVDQGNVDEPAVQVQVTLAPPGAGAPLTQSAIVSLAAGRSVVAVLGPFAVHAGTAYTLQVTAAPPQGAGAVSSSSGLQVAAVPATTTTTTTRPPRTTRPAPPATTTTVPARHALGGARATGG